MSWKAHLVWGAQVWTGLKGVTDCAASACLFAVLHSFFPRAKDNVEQDGKMLKVSLA